MGAVKYPPPGILAKDASIQPEDLHDCHIFLLISSPFPHLLFTQGTRDSPISLPSSPYLRGPLASPPHPIPIPGGCSPSFSKEAPPSEVHFIYQFWVLPLTLAFLGVITCPSSLPLWGQFHRFSLLPKAASREQRRLGWGLEKLPVSALSETLRRNGTFNNCSSVMRKRWGPTAITQTLFWALCTYQVKWKTFWLGLTGW